MLNQRYSQLQNYIKYLCSTTKEVKVFFQGKEMICPFEKTFDNEVGQLKVQRQCRKKN